MVVFRVGEEVDMAQVVASCIFCGWLLSVNSSVLAADIYRSERPDGSFLYASQPYDPSYVLFLRGTADAVGQVPQASKFQQGGSAPTKVRASIEKLITELSGKHDIDASLVRAVIEVESNFVPNAKSAKGAAGLMQLMPITARRYGASNRNDPVQNIEAGIRYLKSLLALHDGNVALALASYNAGQYAVVRHGRRIPPYKETMLYVPAVLSRMQAASIRPHPESR